jgi:UDPglucose 6-dehydrogenase
MKKIGIVGFGFLGRALAHGFIDHADIKIYDKYENYYDTLENVVNNSDFIFVSVPTPMSDDGSQDLSNLEDAIKSIVEISKERKIIVLRSTIIPGTTRLLADKYIDHDFVFFPEFLTERNANLDFINSSRLIFGGDEEVLLELEDLFRLRFPHTPIYKTSWEAAEIVKYMCNCFFAVKISYLNEIYDIAKYYDIDYNELKNMFLSDYRIGNSHVDVPGHDGYRGFGGKCLLPNAKVRVNGVLTTMQDLFNSLENRTRYFIEGTDYEIENKESKEIEKMIESYIKEDIYKFCLENGKIFSCTKNHLVPVIRKNKKILIEAQYIENTDLFFIE